MSAEMLSAETCNLIKVTKRRRGRKCGILGRVGTIREGERSVLDDILRMMWRAEIVSTLSEIAGGAWGGRKQPGGMTKDV